MNIKNINDLANLDLNKITDPQELEAILAFLDREIATAMKSPPLNPTPSLSPNLNLTPNLNPPIPPPLSTQTVSQQPTPGPSPGPIPHSALPTPHLPRRARRKDSVLDNLNTE